MSSSRHSVVIDSFSGEFAFLSNFYRSRVALDGVTYPTVEHAYQAAKTHDEALRAQIRIAATPGEAKRLGRKVPLRPDWEGVKVDVMHDLLVQKFADPFLGNMLRATNGATLIESNTWNDRTWGMVAGEGKNLLGKLLEEVRIQLCTATDDEDG